MKPRTWCCPNCRLESPDDAVHCPVCYTGRYASWSIMLAEHVLEHLADGLSEPLDVLKAMTDRPCYARTPLTLQQIAQQMRLLTKDTTQLARQIAKARASRLMLDVCETGDAKDKIAVLKGIQVLGDVVTHEGAISTTVTHHYVDVKRDEHT